MPTGIAAEVRYRCMAAGNYTFVLGEDFFWEFFQRIISFKPRKMLELQAAFFSEWCCSSCADCRMPAGIEMDVCLWVLFARKRADEKAVL